MKKQRYVPEGILARLEGYKTQESKDFYQNEKDVGFLHGHYIQDVGALWDLVLSERQALIPRREIEDEVQTRASIYFGFWDRVKILFGASVHYAVSNEITIMKTPDGPYAQGKVIKESVEVRHPWKKYFTRRPVMSTVDFQEAECKTQ